MAYNPSQHTVTNKAIGIGQATPTDARSYFYDEALFRYRPFQDAAEVLAYLDTVTSRTGQFPIFINDGALDTGTGEFSGGIVHEYWFKNGVADGDLIEKTISGGYKKMMFKESDGDMTIGETDFTSASLVGATELFEITVNKIIEYVGDDFSFDSLTGTIDRTPNQWFAGDKMVVGFKTT